MKHPYYRAAIFLSGEITDQKGVKGIAAFYTQENLNKQDVLNYVKELHKQGIICSYRMLFNPSGNKVDWYNDTEAVYLPEGSRPIFSSMPN